MSRISFLKSVVFVVVAALSAQAQGLVRVLYWGGTTTSSHNPGALRDTLTPYFNSNAVIMTYRSAASPVWLHPDSLAQYDVLMIYTTNQVGNDLTTAQLTNLYNWVDSGKVIVALHGATNTFLNGTNTFRATTTTAGWRQLLGAQFVDHGASNNSGTITFKLPITHGSLTGVSAVPASASADPGGSANTPFWDEGRTHNQFASDTVVLARAQVGSASYPWIWVRPQGKGFVYYNASGHNHRVFTRPEFKGQILQALRWGAMVGSTTSLRGERAVKALARMQGDRLWIPSDARSVRVHDLSGKNVLLRNGSLEKSYDLSSLPLGYYSIEVLTQKEVFRSLYVKRP